MKSKGKIFLKLAARALLVGLQDIPGAGTVIKIGQECWKVLQEAQEQEALDARIEQLEQATACTAEEARELATQAIAESRQAGQTVTAERAEAVVDLLSVMPAAIGERTRVTLSHARRQGTAAVTVLPVTNRFATADRETFYTSLFPLRRPQFHAGDPLPHGNAEWRLERLIGAGGFGEVWLARHQRIRSKAPMAIKFCQDVVSAKLLQRETDNLDLLIEKLPVGTPHIVALLDAQLTHQPYWLAFEYIDGGTLESQMRLGPMAWPQAWQLLQPILQGMSLVHDLNIVHRDLKPANILLDSQQRPYIADFGIGKILTTQIAAVRQSQRAQSLTTRGYGSVGYMSPEQQNTDLPAHAADDVYALGIILWQMLQGSVRQMPEFPDDITDLVVPDAVKQALVACRFARRDKRPQHARALLEKLALPKLVEGNGGRLRQAQPAPLPVQPQVQSQAAAIQHGHYLIHPDGTVTDTRTKLMWKRCAEGQTWDGNICVGDAKKMIWDEIMPQGKQKSWPAFAEHDDWRVPTVGELKSLLFCSSGKPKTWKDTGHYCEGDYQKPTIDQTAFPNTPATGFWTASPTADNSLFVHFVYFVNGGVGSTPRGNRDAVRLVRVGQ